MVTGAGDAVAALDGWPDCPGRGARLAVSEALGWVVGEAEPPAAGEPLAPGERDGVDVGVPLAAGVGVPTDELGDGVAVAELVAAAELVAVALGVAVDVGDTDDVGVGPAAAGSVVW